MKALTPWRPLAQLSTLHKDLDELFTRFFGEEGGEHWGGFEGGLVPAIESFTRGNELVFRADLPGIDPKNVELYVEGNRLTIRGERKEEHKEKEGGRRLREVRYGRFERVLALPAAIDPETVQARYEHGVLEVTVKAPRELTGKKVPIATG